MRKQPKSFTVEVKRRPGGAQRKPAFVEAPASGAEAAAAAADVLFRTVDTPTVDAAPQPERRILQCLVTEAALDAAHAEATAESAPRRRGRPPKPKATGESGLVAPRKRGRPRKNPLPEARFELSDEAERVVAVTITTPYTPSERALVRRTAVAALPRGERWKRRLPRVLR